MKKFFVFITAVTALYKERIVYGLVNKGYKISELGESETLSSDASAFITLQLETENCSLNTELIRLDVHNCMNSFQGKYHSMIVTSGGVATFCGANFTLPPPEEDPV